MRSTGKITTLLFIINIDILLPTVLKLMRYKQNKLRAEMSFPELISICLLKFQKTDERNKLE